MDVDKIDVGRSASVHTVSLKKNAVYNIIRHYVGILVPLIMYPIVSQRLGTEFYGKVSFADSVVSCFTIIAMFGIPTYAIREGARIKENKSEIHRFTNEMFTLNILMLLLTASLNIILTITIPKLRECNILILVFGIGLIANVLGRDWLNTVFEDFAYLDIRYILFHIIGLVFVMLFVNKPEDYIRYAFLLMLMNAGANIVNLFYSRKYAPYGISTNAEMLNHLKPLMYFFLTALAVRIYVNSDVIVIGFMKTDSDVGVYSLASKIYLIVKTIINAAVAVAIPRLSGYLGRGETDSFTYIVCKIRSLLVIVLLPATTGLFMLSYEIMYVLGGEEYIVGYKVLRVLCFALFFAVMGNYYANAVLVPLKNEKLIAIITMISAVLNLVLNIFLIPFMGIVGAAASTVISEMIVLVVCRMNSKGYICNLDIELVIGAVIGSAIVLGICHMVLSQSYKPIIAILICVPICAVVYSMVIALVFLAIKAKKAE